MKVQQITYKETTWWSSNEINEDYQLVLAFISPIYIEDKNIYKSLKWFYPKADIILISTSWEIMWTEVSNKTISVTALKFDKTPIKVISEKVETMEDSFSVASSLAKKLLTNDLKYVLVFSDGLWVNGSLLVKWMKAILPKNIWVTWWLAWDNADFKKTYVWLNSDSSEENNIVMIWLYGDSIKVWNSSLGWWDQFGIERKITKSKWNILYTLDWEPVLDLYKKYLWNKAEWLPGSWLMFPISIFNKNKDTLRVRTLLSIDEKEKSITFAWDVPEGYSAYLMKANFNRLIEWAWDSAKNAFKYNSNPLFALVISCVWRKLVLKQRIDDEIEAISDIIWKDCSIWWFYSYWEIWTGNEKNNEKILDYFLHNQTMTIALLSEN